MAQVSVIIPFLNAESYIVSCVASVLGQSLREVEVICVDNGSTDRSRHLVEALAARDKRIRLADCAVEGSGNARNVGMALARGDYFAFVDADDYLPTEASLETLLMHALATSAELSRGNVCIEHSGLQTTKPLETLGVPIWWEVDVLTDYDSEPRLWMPVQHQAFLICRSFIEANELAYPSLMRGQDAPFLLTAMMRAKRVHCASTTSYVYRKGHRGHAVLKTLQILVDFVLSVRNVRQSLLQEGKCRQWHLVLARTCAYLWRVCPTSYLLSDKRVVNVLRTLVVDIDELGRVDYAPYSMGSELKSVHMMARAIT